MGTIYLLRDFASEGELSSQNKSIDIETVCSPVIGGWLLTHLARVTGSYFYTDIYLAFNTFTMFMCFVSSQNTLCSLVAASVGPALENIASRSEGSDFSHNYLQTTPLGQKKWDGQWAFFNWLWERGKMNLVLANKGLTLLSFYSVWIQFFLPSVEFTVTQKKKTRGKGRSDTLLELVSFVEEITSIDSSNFLFAIYMYLLIEHNN